MELNHEDICGIGNTYGCLIILEHDGKYYWLIEDYNTNLNNLDEYEEISRDLYLAIKKEYE